MFIVHKIYFSQNKFFKWNEKFFLTLIKINSKKMEITIKDLEKIKTLPKELLGNVNDYIDFLKENTFQRK